MAADGTGPSSPADRVGGVTIEGWGRRRSQRAPLGRAAESPEACPQFLDEYLRLFPGCEVAATLDLIPMNEVGEGPLGPYPRRAEDFAGEDCAAHRQVDFGEGAEILAPALPVHPRRRAAGVGEPV